MSKIYCFLIALLTFVIVFPGRVSAQGMMNFGNFDNEANQNLSDDEYEKSGEQWMEVMTGDKHEEADEQMKSMMGYGGENAVRTPLGNPMFYGYKSSLSGVYAILTVVTWSSLIAFLLAGARWLWKKAAE